MKAFVRRKEAYKQNIPEGFFWFDKVGDYGPQAKLGKIAVESVKNLELKDLFMVAVHGLARVWRERKPLKERTKNINPNLEVVGKGAEVTVIRDGGWVKKYLTGKAHRPKKLFKDVKRRHEAVAPVMKEFFPETTISIEKPDLRVKGKQLEYVTLTQAYIEAEYIDPQNDPELLAARPDIREQLQKLATTAEQLVTKTGYILDFVNTGNVIWGKTADDEESKLYFVDTICPYHSDKNIPGLWSPGWSVERYFKFMNKFVSSVKEENFS